MLKSFLAKLLSKIIRKKINQWASNPIKTQQKVFKNLIRQAKNTKFGIVHDFKSIDNYVDFRNSVPIREYEGLKSYIEEIRKGGKNILWKGKPLYFAKTSGTTSGVKYIPITKDSIPTHISAAKNALLMYLEETGDSSFLNGKMIFLQGSPVLKEDNGIKIGRLSGIVAHYVPSYLQKNRMPKWSTNCISDWEEKLDKIVNETINQDMTVISGIPSWIQMYFERIIEIKKKPISEVFPNFNLFIYGGVNFEPYRAKFDEMIGKKITHIELYPASEGFIAFQDNQFEQGMLLLLDNGIYYEFIKADEFYSENPKRINISEVELNTNYVIILNTNAGLWGYNIGDTIEFVSLKPHRIRVTGRIKHFISAFGEHVISKEVEQCIKFATQKDGQATVREFTVAPQVNPQSGLPYHEWFIEFDRLPKDVKAFTINIDEHLQVQNIYYKDLITGNILQKAIISQVEKEGFYKYMKLEGKLGGQNKIPKLSDNRKIANILTNYLVKN